MNNGRPALVILSPGFPENEADTTCLPAQQSFVRLLRQHYPSLEIVVVAFQYPFTKKAYEWNQITVLPLNGRNRRKPWRLLTWMRAWRTVEQIKKRYHIIGLFSFFCGECALVGQWFGRRHDISHRCWILGQDARKGNFFVSCMRPVADDLVAMSNFLADEFHRNYGIRPAHIIPSGVDPAEFGLAPGKRTIDVLAAGSLIPLKRHDVFLEVMSRLKLSIPDIYGLICGKGAEEERLRALIRQYGLENNVRLTGELPHPELLRCMQQSRILLHPSSYEGFGTVCLEALYAGTQVISFVRPMTAFIANWHIVADPDEMVAKTLELLRQPDTDHAPVMAYSMLDNVRSVLQLFPYKELPI